MTAPGNYAMKHGKYYGDRISTVPAGYLRWMISEKHVDADKAQAELERRAAEETQ